MRNGNVEEPAEEPAHNSINCTLRNGNFKEEVTDVTMYEVLIVPCGMETCLRNGLPPATNVLIVPCGMETTFLERQVDITDCINCTLRNGNDTGAVTRSMSWKY